jgi:hypothetical protein
MKLWELEKGRKVRIESWGSDNWIRYDSYTNRWKDINGTISSIDVYYYSDNWEYYEESTSITNAEILTEIRSLVDKLEVKLCLKIKEKV